VRIERFDPVTDAERLRACYEIFEAGQPADDPNGPGMSPRAFAGWWAFGWTSDPRETWLAADADGEPVGCYLLELPALDNTTTGAVVPLVAPSRRRSGIGSALLRHAAGRAAGSGRTLLRGECGAGSPGAAFALARGARRGLDEVRRVLDVGSVPAGHLRGLRERAGRATAGYSLLRWPGPIPEEHLDQVAAVYATMADAPHNPSEQAQHWDAARVRAADERTAAQGLRFYSVAAGRDATGELAALTQLGVDPDRPAWGFQQLTAVTRAHRGHRLGLLVKVAMLELLAEREPQLSTIITGNADTNEHMIAINDALGYKVLDRWASWELDVAGAV
jgi:GNAT superfamily N-acetyltransferase/RimJ/RimL family protein N-acetyltransferase